jgi:hypothetical protein
MAKNAFVSIKFENFFDRKAVIDAATKAERQQLSKWGAYVRTRSKQSIRKRKKVSLPGQPPSSHEGSLKRLIFFAYDKQDAEVVAGPLLFSSRPGADLLEFGGRRYGKSYKARPYMRPAADSVNKDLPDIFANSIK